MSMLILLTLLNITEEPNTWAEFNKRVADNVIQEHNAVPLLWQAIGPMSGDTPVPKLYFDTLGIPVPPKQGNYLIHNHTVLSAEDRFEYEKAAELDNAIKQSTHTPWNKSDHPLVAKWVAANEKPLEIVARALARPLYFSPMVEVDVDGRSRALLYHLSACREFGTLLASRAMLKLQSGQIESAWSDILNCHRLGRLVQQGGTIGEARIGYEIEELAVNAAARLAVDPRTKPTLIRQALTDLDKLPKMPPMRDKTDGMVRLSMLQMVEELEKDPKQQKLLDGRKVDWVVARATANALADRFVERSEIRYDEASLPPLPKIEKSVRKIYPSFHRVEYFLHFLSAKELGEVAGETTISVLKKHTGVLGFEVQAAQRLQLERIVLGLALYQKEQGHYPKTLAELKPRYLESIPSDYFTGKPLKYELKPNGFRLYSLGENQIPNDPNAEDDDYRQDDVKIELPPAKKKQLPIDPLSEFNPDFNPKK